MKPKPESDTKGNQWVVNEVNTKLIVELLKSINFEYDGLISLPKLWRSLTFTPSLWSQDSAANSLFQRWKKSPGGLKAKNENLVDGSKLSVKLIFPFLDSLGYSSNLISFGATILNANALEISKAPIYDILPSAFVKVKYWIGLIYTKFPKKIEVHLRSLCLSKNDAYLLKADYERLLKHEKPESVEHNLASILFSIGETSYIQFYCKLYCMLHIVFEQEHETANIMASIMENFGAKLSNVKTNSRFIAELVKSYDPVFSSLFNDNPDWISLVYGEKFLLSFFWNTGDLSSVLPFWFAFSTSLYPHLALYGYVLAYTLTQKNTTFLTLSNQVLSRNSILKLEILKSNIYTQIIEILAANEILINNGILLQLEEQALNSLEALSLPPTVIDCSRFLEQGVKCSTKECEKCLSFIASHYQEAINGTFKYFCCQCIETEEHIFNIDPDHNCENSEANTSGSTQDSVE